MQRSPIERLMLSLAFELGGLVLAVPLYRAVFGRTGEASLTLIVTLAIAVLFWNPLHNRLFDAAEHRLTGRDVRMRPHRLRLVHALSHEITPIVVTLPIIMALGHHSLTEALAVNLGLTGLYVAYAYGFYLAVDRLRPATAKAGPTG
jgi:uncharacterized membrane protein